MIDVDWTVVFLVALVVLCLGTLVVAAIEAMGFVLFVIAVSSILLLVAGVLYISNKLGA